MNNKRVILDFLNDLSHNNHKEWIDDNRNYYNSAKELWLEQVQEILNMLSNFDNKYYQNFKPKDRISRITNNRIFNPNLPIYKDFFTFSIMDKTDGSSPLYISIGNENSFVGSGYHNPEKQTLKNIRDAIDYDGNSLKEILEEPTFKNFYGGLSTFTEPLKTSPKGYPKDHPYVDFLRFKNYCVDRKLTKEEFLGDNFLELITKTHKLSIPLTEFFKQANSI